MAENKNVNNENEELDQVVLTLEDESELVCDVIAYFPCDGKNYVALLPVDDPDSDFLLPEEVVHKTIAKYREAYQKLTGENA